MKGRFTIILASIMMFSSVLVAQEWTVTEMGICPNDKTYGVCVGNVHNDDIERVYVTTRGEPLDASIYEWTYETGVWTMTSTLVTDLRNLVTITVGDVRGDGVVRLYAVEWGGTSSRVFEYTWNGSGWDEVEIDTPGAGMLSCVIGDVRGDEVVRLYVAGYPLHREYTWNGSGWDMLDINLVNGTEGPIAIGEGKNDGIVRYYTPGSRVREYSWNGSSYDETAGVSVVDGWPETVVVEDIRNDGTNRIMTEDYNGTYEYTWNGSSWDEVVVDSRAGRSFLFAAQTKADEKYYIYNTDTESDMREYAWNGTSYDITSIDAATGATGLVDVGTGRNDNVVRLYAPGYASGKIYEITNDDPLVVNTTGVLPVQEVNAQILYNSNASTISVLNKTGETGKIVVYDLSGKMIMNGEVNDKHQTYALGNLTQGIYLINLTIGSKVKNKKIFVN